METIKAFFDLGLAFSKLTGAVKAHPIWTVIGIIVLFCKIIEWIKDQ